MAINPNTGWNTCFNIALGYGGSWYGESIYAGTPACAETFENGEAPTIKSNVRDLCLVRC